MGAIRDVTVTASAATAIASTPAPTVAVTMPVSAALAMGMTPAPTVVITSITALASVTYAYVAAPDSGLHLEAHDPIVYGTDLFVLVAALFVGGKFVRERIFRV
jgi:hypothetical protein